MNERNVTPIHNDTMLREPPYFAETHRHIYKTCLSTIETWGIRNLSPFFYFSMFLSLYSHCIEREHKIYVMILANKIM